MVKNIKPHHTQQRSDVELEIQCGVKNDEDLGEAGGGGAAFFFLKYFKVMYSLFLFLFEML